MKRKIIIIGIILSVFAIISAGTFAYYTASGTAENVITAGGVEFIIHEKTADGSEYSSDGVSVMPGDSVSKIVTVENIGDHPFYLRVELSKGNNKETLSVEDCMYLDLNTTEWTYSDGYYYYNTAVLPGNTTVPLFTKVDFDLVNVDNDYLGTAFSLKIDASAVQSENNGETVWDAVGWSENDALSEGGDE